MKRLLLLGCAAALAAAPLLARQSPADVANAVGAPGRPGEMVALDADRRPAEVLNFEGLKAGDQVADIMGGSGYYTESLARAVGPKGHVTAYDPQQFVGGDAQDAATWAALTKRQANVTRVVYPFDKFAAPRHAYDFVMIHLNYHDLYWESAKFGVPRIAPADFLKTLFAAVKPGGTVAVIDHVALPGETRPTVDKLHRIDPETVKLDFKAAGFLLDGWSDMLRNTTDDHSKLVFDPSVRGRTDRFVFRFKKPKG